METNLIFRNLTQREQQVVKAQQALGARVVTLPGLNIGSLVGVGLFPDSLVKDSAHELIDLIKSIGDKLIYGQHVSKLLTIEKVPLWHYQRFRVFFLLKNAWLVNHCIEYYTREGDKLICYVPAGITVFSSTKETELIEEPVSKVTKTRNFKALFNYILFFKLRVIISLFRNNRLKTRQHVIVDRSIRQQCRNINTLEKKWDNYNLSPLFDLNQPGLLIISEVETPKFNNRQPFLLHSYYFNGEGRKDQTVYGEWILFRGVISPSVYRKQKELLHHFDIATAKVLELNLDDREKTVFKTFTGLRKSSSFYLLKFLCYRRFFKKHSFVNIATIDENSPATRSILDAARVAGMETIGIQHGNIGDTQPAYLYTEPDKANHVMADKTIVWGQYWSDFLISQANYKADSVFIAGQMRSDIIPVMLQRSGAFREKLTDSPFLVTFASQPIPDSEMRYRVAFDVFSYFRDKSDAKLIVKLHPAEWNSFDYYHDIATEAGCNDAQILYKVDLYELLAASDLVITCYSTVGSEAVYFGKPLIIYDPYKEDLLGYVKEGIAMQATDRATLSDLIQKVKIGELVPDHQQYDKFVSKYAHAIDGQATRRTIRIITGEVSPAPH